MHRIVCLDGATLYPAHSEQWERLNKFGICNIYDRTGQDEVISRAADADILLTNKVPITGPVIKALPNLKYIGIIATGYNIVDIKAAKEAGIVVTNVPAYSTESVAQHTIALLMAITSRVESYSRSVKDGDWCRCRDFSYRMFEWGELSGKIFGIIGLGSIGKAVAQIATSLKMKVAVVSSKRQEELPVGYVKMGLDELFTKADVISLHCPLTEDNRHMVNEDRLRLMKDDAIILNTARGPLIDEYALAKALNENWIYGAGLDVLCDEPPKEDCPLLTARNCFITPHIAWASRQARIRLLETTANNIEAYISGKSINIVS